MLPGKSQSLNLYPLLQQGGSLYLNIILRKLNILQCLQQLQMITANLNYMNPIVSELKTVHEEWQKCQVETGSDEKGVINLTPTPESVSGH